MELKVKDWVLVRDDDDDRWKLDIFSYKDEVDDFRCVGSFWKQCIPYEGNEVLLGKTEAPKEKHVWHAGDRVDVFSDCDDMWHSGFIVEIDYTRSGAGFSYRVESECFKGRNSSGACWCRADQLRKPEEKPEEEEFKFGDKVEVNFAGDWREAVIIEIDASSIPYKVATPDGDIHWCTKSRVRRA